MNEELAIAIFFISTFVGVGLIIRGMFVCRHKCKTTDALPSYNASVATGDIGTSVVRYAYVSIELQMQINATSVRMYDELNA